MEEQGRRAGGGGGEDGWCEDTARGVDGWRRERLLRQSSWEPCLHSTSGPNQFHFRIKVLRNKHSMCRNTNKSILLVLKHYLSFSFLPSFPSYSWFMEETRLLKESPGAFGRTAQMIMSKRKYDNMPILKKTSHTSQTLYTLTWRCVRWLIRLFYVCTASSCLLSLSILQSCSNTTRKLDIVVSLWYCCVCFYSLLLHNNHKTGEMQTGSFIVTSLLFFYFLYVRCPFSLPVASLWKKTKVCVN